MLTAAKNPVTVWGPNSTGTTTITWNTGNAAVLGRVFMTVTENGIMGPETVFDGKTPAAAGSKPLPVRLGSAYRLELRRASDNAVLDTLTVTVERIASPVIIRSLIRPRTPRAARHVRAGRPRARSRDAASCRPSPGRA